MRLWEPESRLTEDESTRKARDAMEALHQLFMGQAIEQKLNFIDAIETGTPACDSTYNEIAAPLRTIDEKWVELIRSFHGEPFRLFLLDYCPQILKPDEFAEARKFYEMKLERSPAYLKHRSLPTARQWVEAGFHLVSDNPADYFLIRWRLIDDFSSDQCAQPKAMADAVLAVAEANSLQVCAGDAGSDANVEAGAFSRHGRAGAAERLLQVAEDGRQRPYLILYPYVTFYFAASAEKRFLNTGTTTWDGKAGTVVIGKNIGKVRQTVAVTLTVLSFIGILIWCASSIPSSH